MIILNIQNKKLNLNKKSNRNSNKGLNLVEVTISIAIISIIILAAINTMYYTNISNQSFNYNQIIREKINTILANKFKVLENQSLPINNNQLIRILNTQKNDIVDALKNDNELKQNNITIKDIYFTIKNSNYISNNDNTRKRCLIDLRTTVKAKMPKFSNKTLIIINNLNITIKRSTFFNERAGGFSGGFIRISSPIKKNV